MISIIIPVYKAETFFDECVSSILAQSYEDFELILVDDGSPDKCPELCDKWAATDSRIKVIHKSNGGVSSARNSGLEIASGDYICFVDSDDTLPENGLHILMKSIEQRNVEVVFGAFQFQYGDRLLPHASRLPEGKYQFKYVLKNFIDDGTLSGFLLGSTCAALYKREIILKNHLRFVEGLKNNEDGLFNFELALLANSFAVINTPVYNYRQDNAPSKPNRMNENFGEKVFDILDMKEWPKDKYEYDIQKARRKVTLAWWDILHFATDYSLFKSLVFIRKKITQPNVRKGINYMRPEKMNLYKRVIFYLMKYRLCFTFYFLLKYVMPVMQKRIAR